MAENRLLRCHWLAFQGNTRKNDHLADRLEGYAVLGHLLDDPLADIGFDFVEVLGIEDAVIRHIGDAVAFDIANGC